MGLMASTRNTTNAITAGESRAEGSFDLEGVTTEDNDEQGIRSLVENMKTLRGLD